MYVYVFVCIHIYVQTGIHTCMYLCPHIPTDMLYVCIYVHTCIHTCIYVHRGVHTPREARACRFHDEWAQGGQPCHPRLPCYPRAPQGHAARPGPGPGPASIPPAHHQPHRHGNARRGLPGRGGAGQGGRRRVGHGRKQRGMSREGGPGTGSGTGSLLRRLRDSETRRLELERKLMEYKKSDAYLMKLKYTKLKKYLEELNERQKRALLRNQAILKELNQFEAHMKTSSSELIQKMEWYGREIKSVLSLREGNLSAQGDEKEYNKQNPWVLRQAGIHSGTATSRGLYHPATIFMGRHMSAAWSMQQKAPQAAESRSVPEPCSHRQAVLSSDQTDRCLLRVGSDMPCTNKRDKQDGKADVLLQEKMPITSRVALVESSMHSSLSHLTEHRNLAECHLLSPNRASVESRTADLNSDTSVEGEEVTCEHLVASAEDYKQAVPVAFVPEPSISEEDQESIPGMMEPLPDCAGAHTSQTDAPGCCFFSYTSCILLEV
uniref:Centrosomal protein kizuna n=1 Tax=Anser brachyrhynchus TaxID=132585 RepID=A0A8B9I6D6_9AVES